MRARMATDEPEPAEEPGAIHEPMPQQPEPANDDGAVDQGAATVA